jgi:hypothetical protein
MKMSMLCTKCGEHIYNVDESYIVSGGLMRADMFEPANDLIPRPKKGDLILCPVCHKMPFTGDNKMLIKEKGLLPKD